MKCNLLMEKVSRRSMLVRLAGICVLAGTSTLGAAEKAPWMQNVESALGWKGQVQDSVLTFSCKLDAVFTLYGARYEPALGLHGFAAFSQQGDQTFMTVEIPLREDSVQAVLSLAEELGLSVEALHNHLIKEFPRTIFVHMTGTGSAGDLGGKLRQILSKAGGIGRTSSTDNPELANLKSMVESILGTTAMIEDSIVVGDVPFADVSYMGSFKLLPPQGAESEFRFQKLAGGRVALAAEICLSAVQVKNVIAFLRREGFVVSALHNHFLYDEPRLFFVHAFGIGNAEDIVKTARAVFDQGPSQL